MAVRKAKAEEKAEEVTTPDLVPYEPGGSRATMLEKEDPKPVDQITQQGSTLADRYKARMKAESKRVGDAENK